MQKLDCKNLLCFCIQDHNSLFYLKHTIHIDIEWGWGRGREVCFVLYKCISVAVWQFRELLFSILHFANDVKKACRQLIFYLGNVCLMVLVFEVSSESHFVESLLWFHFIWNLAENESWRKKILVYILSPAQSRGRVWINYDSVWSQYLCDRVFMCFVIFYYNSIFGDCIFLFLYVQSNNNDFLLVYFIASFYRWAIWM